MSSPADSFESLQQATAHAQAARSAGDTSSLLASLCEIKAILDERSKAGSGFDSFVAIQAVQLAIEAKDPDLAQQLAECSLRDVTERLAWLNEQYSALASQKDHEKSRAVLQEAYACANAFVPRVMSPPIVWMLMAFEAKQKQAGAAVRLVLEKIRPTLIKAGWSAWPYSPDVIVAADRAAAQTLIHTANAIMESDKGELEGLVVEQALRCALNAQALLPQESRDQLMADCKNVLGQIFYALGTAGHEDALHVLKNASRLRSRCPTRRSQPAITQMLGPWLCGQASFLASTVMSSGQRFCVRAPIGTSNPRALISEVMARKKIYGTHW